MVDVAISDNPNTGAIIQYARIDLFSCLEKFIEIKKSSFSLDLKLKCIHQTTDTKNLSSITTFYSIYNITVLGNIIHRIILDCVRKNKVSILNLVAEN
ncbi:hypothetical protein BpHYR1_012083 [Brachionus plicatilis]|uniref:Uncharacterized protein n=1 Tax=Brachionus plicatilis TaxID=10195 RepID=A0A3M7SSU6_BRAPC|nr:hypothetical protein BpHYR1_012083 [Brachionus plicatilis]